MATTGSSLAAINAGIIPEATPTNEEIPIPKYDVLEHQSEYECAQVYISAEINY
jgi:hypothetical protein